MTLAELAVDAAKVSGLTDTVPELLRFFADMFAAIDPKEL